MSETILTKSNKAGREVEVVKPEVLTLTEVSDFVATLGEELVVKTILSSLTVSFRAHVRGKLESQTDGDFTYEVEDIAQMDFSDWKPESRTRKTAEEKAAELFGKMSPDEIRAALAAAGIEA